MNVFIDTNVWISAFLNTGTSNELIERCLMRHRLQSSAWVLHEIEKTLRKKYNSLNLPIEFILDFLREETDIVEEVAITNTSRDPDDDHILAAALGGNADCIITGDKDLLSLTSFKSISILSPRQFWQFEMDK